MLARVRLMPAADPASFVHPDFAPVAEEFERNFTAHGELGAAFAATVEGEIVVDLWGGFADRRSGRVWERETLQVIFSGTKGLVAICMLVLIQRGDLKLETRVAEHWPEFAAAGKGEVTVRELLTHTARLPGFTEPVSFEDLADDRGAASLLAAQAQFTDPRAARCYHPLTFGWLCGELLRRVDGRSIGRFFAEVVAEPLELEIYIGLPEELEPRVSRLELFESWPTLPYFDPSQIAEDPLSSAAWSNPPLFVRESFPWNGRLFHAAEIPGGGAIATARSMATLYGNLDRILAPETLALATAELERRVDGFSPPEETLEAVYGAGFALQSDLMEMGPPADAFGFGGAGGSTHGRWPGLEVGFSYAMNMMRDDFPEVDLRSQALLEALYRCVKA